MAVPAVTNHHDLSNAELRARLSQRGVPDFEASALVDNRDDETAGELIDEWLAPGRGTRS
jgi:hypothetical protein